MMIPEFVSKIIWPTRLPASLGCRKLLYPKGVVENADQRLPKNDNNVSLSMLKLRGELKAFFSCNCSKALVTGFLYNFKS